MQTIKQQQVATLLCQGLSNKQIARQLYISENTVKYHCKQLFKTHNVQCRTQLTAHLLTCSKNTKMEPCK
ncbi:LuxR C-terminal-related transcriptional regulator [Vibrio sp. 99-8-1]|uniref:response regulator transcription factor n=1 Tax=Vibrio sp. MACH09 TaxID=3025122 RepID=UPI00149353F0|nr:response regulator transcription factor [Vibrio sp. 99-8-1]